MKKQIPNCSIGHREPVQLLPKMGGKIFGSIKDGGQQAVIDASSVSLLLEKDSSLVKTSITDKEGKFLFENLADGNYLVAATSVGYQKHSVNRCSFLKLKRRRYGVLQLLKIPKV